MGFKAKARKHRKDAGEDEKKQKASAKVGELPCGVKVCDNFADKSFGGRFRGRRHRHVGLRRLRNPKRQGSSLQVLLPKVEERKQERRHVLMRSSLSLSQ